MIRGTTPTHTFTLPFSTDQIEKVYVTYKQEISFGQSITIERGKDLAAGLDNCELIGNKIIIELTQDETLALIHGVGVEIQVRVKTVDGIALASQVIKVQAEEILKDGAI